MCEWGDGVCACGGSSEAWYVDCVRVGSGAGAGGGMKDGGEVERGGAYGDGEKCGDTDRVGAGCEEG